MTRDEQDEYIHLQELDAARNVYPCKHEPNAAGTACRHCGLAAEPGTIGPDALVLLARYAATDHTGDRARWTVALTQADIDRRRAVAECLKIGGPQDGLTREAAEYGIAPHPTDPGAAQRQRENADVWRVARHQYDLAREGSLGADTRTNAEYAADHDAHTERELLAGRADADGRTWTDLPPIYLAGAYAIHGAD